MGAPSTEQLAKVPPPIAWRIGKGSQILLSTRERDRHNWSRGVTIRDHGYVLLPEAGKHLHLHLFSQASHAKALKTSLSLMCFHEMICTGVEKGRRSDLCLMVLKRCTKRGESKELLERQRASSAWVKSRSHRVTDHGDLSILVGNVRGWEEGGKIEVRFSFWRAWLTCTCALDLDALDTARKKVFATKEELVVVSALVSACKIQHKKTRSSRREMSDS